MSKKEVPLHALAAYVPEGSLEPVLEYLHRYKIHLTITKERNSILGDYRHAINQKNHRISVNGNLNKYAFLVTLLHEIAHRDWDPTDRTVDVVIRRLRRKLNDDSRHPRLIITAHGEGYLVAAPSSRAPA